MKKGLSVAIVAILTLFVFGGIHAEEPWISVGETTDLTFPLCQNLTVGEYEISVTAYSWTMMSEYSIADVGVAITPVVLPQSLSDKATENKFRVFKLGEVCTLAWDGSTYLVDNVPTPAVKYGVWKRNTTRIGTCSSPANVTIK